MLATLLAAFAFFAAPEPEVTLYYTLDEPVVTPILRRFEAQHHIHVRTVTDAETSKTASLAERLEAERDHPQADVYWGNEPFHTIDLAARGAFDAYPPAALADVPPRYREKTGLWSGMGVRCRMIAQSPKPGDAALSGKVMGVTDFARPELKGRIAISNPAFGTASGHFAALYVLLGEAKYIELLKSWHGNEVRLLGSNSAVADQVAAGNLLAGLTDNDDIANARADGHPLNQAVPDQSAQGPGTLVIPCTLSLIHRAPHPAAARALIDFLADPNVEQELLAAHFLFSPIRETTHVKAIDVDLEVASQSMRKAVETALTILQGR